MTTDMSVIPNMFEGAPWRFEAEASPEERREQADFIAGLNTRDRFSVAGGGYLSPEAYWLAESLILGPGCLVASGVRVDGEVTAGRRCSFNLNSTVAGKVTMGDDVRIAAGAGVWGFNHAYDDPDRPIIEQGIETRGITLGDDVWIGANAVITDGVTIGSHTIVAAGAVVTRDVPAFSVAAGNPARVVRDRRAPRKTDLDGLRDALKSLSDKAARDWRAILAHHRTDARPGYHYSDPRNDADNPIRPDCDAVQIAAMFDAVPDALTKSEWIAHFAGRQDPAMGLYRRDTDTPMPSKPKSLKPDAVHTYDVLCVSYALECLGSAPNHRIAWADLVLPEIEAHLADLPWTREGWHCGALLDHLGTAAYVNARYFGGQSGLDGLFGALLRRCDAQSGLWSPETDGDLLQAVNGFYRLTRGTYAQFGLPLPYAEQAIDTMIVYTARHNFFAGEGRTACNVLDIVHPLMLAAQSSTHRAEERDRTILKTLKGIDAQWVDGRGFAFCADEEPSLQGTEMWLSIAALAALHFDLGDQIGFGLRGIHRFEPAVDLKIRAQV